MCLQQLSAFLNVLFIINVPTKHCKLTAVHERLIPSRAKNQLKILPKNGARLIFAGKIVRLASFWESGVKELLGKWYLYASAQWYEVDLQAKR